MQLGAHIRVCTISDSNGNDSSTALITEPVMYSLQNLARRPAQPWGVSRAAVVRLLPGPLAGSNDATRDYREVSNLRMHD